MIVRDILDLFHSLEIRDARMMSIALEVEKTLATRIEVFL